MVKYLLFYLFTSCIYSASVRLENDAQYPLKAVIQSADGCALGELTLNSQETKIWDDYQSVPKCSSSPSKSMTPFTVHWYCPEGNLFSTCDHVSTGSLVKARGGVGSKTCQPKEEKK